MKRGRYRGPHKSGGPPTAGAAAVREAINDSQRRRQKRTKFSAGKQEQPRSRTAIKGNYAGFCPWKETPNGGPLPEIDRVLVNEYIQCCSNCTGSSSNCSNSNCSSSTNCSSSKNNNNNGSNASGSVSSALCPSCFFNLYIKPRKPCLLRLVREESPTTCMQASDALADARALKHWKDLNYLKQTAGHETIDVEIRGAQGAPSFGKGQYQQLPFGEVLQRLQRGDTSLYVTTQRIASDKYGPKAVCGAPLSGSLAGDFPTAPALAGHLIVSQFNIWMGHSNQGSSTGLHHDFHDNFYCLLRGKKEFRLYSPRLCGLLRPWGCMRSSNCPAIHPNGLISYIPSIREDGAHEGTVLRSRQMALEESIRELEQQLLSTKAGLHAAEASGKETGGFSAEIKLLEDKLAQAEADLDECLEAALAAAGEDSDCDDGDSAGSDGDINQGRLVKEGETPDHFCLENTRRCAAASWEGPVTASNCLERFWSVWVTEGDIYGTFEQPYCDSFWAQHAAKQLQQLQQHASRDTAAAATKKKACDGLIQASIPATNGPQAREACGSVPGDRVLTGRGCCSSAAPAATPAAGETAAPASSLKPRPKCCTKRAGCYIHLKAVPRSRALVRLRRLRGTLKRKAYK